ncbi:MAG: SCO family protein [Acidobacteriota bacterium]|jgi:protein SCO1/2|nr:MAG: hypothetical protein DIU54_12930 [Acidobacteriota bacterium]
MRRRTAVIVAVTLMLAWSAATAAADERYPVTGIVLDARPDSGVFVASIDAIPGYMAAMTMPFRVRERALLERLERGAAVEFTLVVTPGESWAEGIRVRRVQNLEQDPLAARRLALIDELTTGRRAPVVAPGGRVPDFQLVDHKFRPVSLSQFAGRVVAINFTYTTCQLPDFCLRLVNHFGALQRRFAEVLGRDLVFLTITFDPQRDTPDVLDRYAEQWKPDHEVWRFLTGTPAAIRPVLDAFGVSAFVNDGLIDHGLRTAIVGRDGRLAVLLEGNHFSTAQLGDVIDAVLGE